MLEQLLLPQNIQKSQVKRLLPGHHSYPCPGASWPPRLMLGTNAYRNCKCSKFCRCQKRDHKKRPIKPNSTSPVPVHSGFMPDSPLPGNIALSWSHQVFPFTAEIFHSTAPVRFYLGFFWLLLFCFFKWFSLTAQFVLFCWYLWLPFPLIICLRILELPGHLYASTVSQRILLCWYKHSPKAIPAVQLTTIKGLENTLPSQLQQFSLHLLFKCTLFFPS